MDETTFSVKATPKSLMSINLFFISYKFFTRVLHESCKKSCYLIQYSKQGIFKHYLFYYSWEINNRFIYNSVSECHYGDSPKSIIDTMTSKQLSETMDSVQVYRVIAEGYFLVSWYTNLQKFALVDSFAQLLW